jgi:hypothetical protein
VVPGLALSGYATTLVDDSTWPVFALQLCLLVLAVTWIAVSFYRSARALISLLYVSVFMVAVGGVLLALWSTIYQHVHARVEWLWWTLFALLAVQTVLLVGACMALGSLLSCRLIFDAHLCLTRAIDAHTDEQLSHAITPHERVGEDAVYFQQLAPTTVRKAMSSSPASTDSSFAAAAAAAEGAAGQQSKKSM